MPAGGGTVIGVKRIAIGVVALVLGLLVVAQLALPPLAERYVRDEVRDRGGEVASVQVSAFPAVKLVFRHADEVRLRLRSAQLGAGDLAEQLHDARNVDRLDATVVEMQLGPLRLRDLQLHKRGGALTGEAGVTREDLAAALPAGLDVEPVATGGGELTLQASVGPLTARARLSASDGALRIAPDGLLGGFASVTVFDDPRVAVTGVGARPRADGFTLTAAGRLAA